MKYLRAFKQYLLSEGVNKPNYKKLEIDGFLVYQGRDSQSNDWITFELAKDDDLWFHARGVPGSHVVIVVGDSIPTLETIKKVATVAAKNSKSKSDEIPVVYCKRKFVKKEQGMNPGQVAVDRINAEEIIVNRI